MTDIFNNVILCGKCDLKMKPVDLVKNGFVLRAVECQKCGNKIVHPKDEQEFVNFSKVDASIKSSM